MSLTESVTTCLKKYATFSGRASRSEYWYFSIICSVVLQLMKRVLFLQPSSAVLIVLNVVSLALFIPCLSVAVRRMHDTGHSGWWILFPLYNIYLTFKKSDEGENEYGSLEEEEE